MQFPGQGKPPVGVIFDSAMGSRIDDALAMAVLYGLDGKNEARVVSVSVSKSNVNSAAFSEVIGGFYAGAVSGAFGAFGRNLPVGMADNGQLTEDSPMLLAPLQKKDADGKPVYPHGIHKLVDTAEVSALLRNAFTSQMDQNSMVIVTGPATNLAQVLDLPGIKDWITRKVRYLVIVAGNFAGDEPEQNVKSDVTAAKRLFAEWPTQIIFAGSEIGKAVKYPAASIGSDFAWTPNHPVADAYRAHQPMPYDAETSAMAAVLTAIRPKENYFKMSESGTVSAGLDGRTSFTASAGGKHQYLIFDPAQKDKILQTYIELASAKPVVRAPRFRQQKKQEPAKPVVEKLVDPPKP